MPIVEDNSATDDLDYINDLVDINDLDRLSRNHELGDRSKVQSAENQYDSRMLNLKTLKPDDECYHVEVDVARTASGNEISRMISRNPIRVLAPKQPHSSFSFPLPASLYTSSYGGGLVGGDHVNMKLNIGAGASCIFGTQASTKVFKVEAQNDVTTSEWDAVYQVGAIQRLEAEVGPNAIFLVAPDPVSPFRNSIYFQDQQFSLHQDASLFLLDWITSGRLAHGEQWDLKHLYSRNAISINGKLIYLDALELNQSDRITDTFRLGSFHCYATMVMMGEAFQLLAEKIRLETMSERIHQQKYPDELICVSPLADGVVIRILGKDIEKVRMRINEWMSSLESVLGMHPWSRKW